MEGVVERIKRLTEELNSAFLEANEDGLCVLVDVEDIDTRTICGSRLPKEGLKQLRVSINKPL